MCLFADGSNHNLLSKVKGNTSFGAAHYRKWYDCQNLCLMVYICVPSCVVLTTFPDRYSHHACEKTVVTDLKFFQL